MSTEDRFPIAEPERSLGDLVGELTTEFGALVGSHIDLAKAELAESARGAGKAGGLYGSAGAAGLLALIMGSMAAAWGLAEVMDIGWAFLVVAVVWAVIAVALALAAQAQLKATSLAPQSTIQQVKEDQQWLKTQTN